MQFYVFLLFIYLRCCINGVDWWAEPLESLFFLRVLLFLFQHNSTTTATAITNAARTPDASPQTNIWLTEVLSSDSGISVVEASVHWSIVVPLGTLGILVISVWPAVPDADRSVAWIWGAPNDRMFWNEIIRLRCSKWFSLYFRSLFC